MDDKTLEVLAKQAGLDLYLKEFPEDLRAAAEQVEAQRKALPSHFTASDEPWPGMAFGKRSCRSTP